MIPRLEDTRTADGVGLVLRRYVPRGPRRGVVLATHAMMANGASLDRPRGRGFASRLADEGVETFVLDFRGHGLSESPTRGWTLDDYATLDLPAAVDFAAARADLPARDLVWIGHSLGALVSLIALARAAAPAPRALVLGTANVWRRPTPMRRAIMETFDASARLFGRAPIRALRIGTDDERASYTRHLASFVRTGRFRSADGAIDYDAALPSLRLPILSLVGTGDPLCRVADWRELRDRLQAATHEEVIVPGASHFSIWRREQTVGAVVQFVTGASN